MRPVRSFVGAAIFSGSLIVCPCAGLAEVYLVTDLGTLGGTESRALGINEHGQVVGEAETIGGQQHAFLWLSEPAYGLAAGMNDLGTLGGSESAAFDINNFGVVVGKADASDLPTPQAFKWDSTSGIVLGIEEPLGPSEARAINDFGEIAGTARDPIGFDQAFYLSSDGWLVYFSDVSPGDAVSNGFGLGYAGNMNFAGTYSSPAQAFRIGGETGLVVLDDLGFQSFVHGMNAYNQAVGSVTTPDSEHAALWEFALTDLGTLGGEDSRAYDINLMGQVVGFAYTASETPHAFLWQDDGMIDLNESLPPGSGWELTEARAINDSGQIVGYGIINGETHAFLLHPVACGCDCHADPQCDGVTNVLDVVQSVKVAFRGLPDIVDPNAACPNATSDTNCDGVTNVLDVVHLVNVAFRSADPAVEFCDPCSH